MNTVKNKKSVTILIPAYNEEKNIARIIKDTFSLPEYTTDVLVIIDSKTTDSTESIARKAGARILKVKKSLGKGSNIKEAIPHIRGEFAIQIDADYQFLPNDIPKLINPLLNGYDVTLGTRYEKGAEVEKGSVSAIKLFGSYFLSLTTSLMSGQRITDVMAGFKAFRTPVLIKINPQTAHFGYEAEMAIRAVQYGYKVVNVPISYRKRSEGKSNVSSLKHGVLVLGTIIRTGLMH